MLICGASFAGLAVARELAGSGADVLVIDRYEIGERQTSACGIPTAWLERARPAGLLAADVRRARDPHPVHDRPLPPALDVLDLRLPHAVRRCSPTRGGSTFETAKVERPNRTTPSHTDRGDIRATLIVDALGWRRVLGAGDNVQPPDALLSRGLEVHPHGSGRRHGDLDRPLATCPPATAGASPPDGELRIGVGSFDPRFHVREPTVRLATDLSRRDTVRYQGNWIPHALRPATEDGVFFVGDSAGHCLPLTAEGIRTALYFGLAVGRELRTVLVGERSTRMRCRATRGSAPRTRAPYAWMLRCQRLVPRVAPRLLAGALRAMEARRFLDWSFGHYLEIAHPRFVTAGPRRTPRQSASRPRRPVGGGLEADRPPGVRPVAPAVGGAQRHPVASPASLNACAITRAAGRRPPVPEGPREADDPALRVGAGARRTRPCGLRRDRATRERQPIRLGPRLAATRWRCSTPPGGRSDRRGSTRSTRWPPVPPSAGPKCGQAQVRGLVALGVDPGVAVRVGDGLVLLVADRRERRIGRARVRAAGCRDWQWPTPRCTGSPRTGRRSGSPSDSRSSRLALPPSAQLGRACVGAAAKPSGVTMKYTSWSVRGRPSASTTCSISASSCGVGQAHRPAGGPVAARLGAAVGRQRVGRRSPHRRRSSRTPPVPWSCRGTARSGRTCSSCLRLVGRDVDEERLDQRLVARDRTPAPSPPAPRRSRGCGWNAAPGRPRRARARASVRRRGPGCVGPSGRRGRSPPKNFAWAATGRGASNPGSAATASAAASAADTATQRDRSLRRQPVGPDADVDRERRVHLEGAPHLLGSRSD